MVRRYSKDLEDFHRKFILPFEEWRISGRHWPGGYRWFRSENVFAIEHYKRVRAPGLDRAPAGPACKWFDKNVVPKLFVKASVSARQ